MKWRVYYDNGKIFTEESDPYDIPRTGVQAIAQPSDRVGWSVMHSADAYYWEEPYGWNKADEYTKWDHLCRAKYPLLIFGRMMAWDEYQEVLKRVNADLPTPKTGRHRGER